MPGKPEENLNTKHKSYDKKNYHLNIILVALTVLLVIPAWYAVFIELPKATEKLRNVTYVISQSDQMAFASTILVSVKYASVENFKNALCNKLSVSQNMTIPKEDAFVLCTMTNKTYQVPLIITKDFNGQCRFISEC